jgi:uncharacterized protein
MIERHELHHIAELVENFPAVAILGPRQVGKTTLARQIADNRPSLYLDLESEDDRIKLTDAAGYLRLHKDKLIILDEVQRVPELFQTLRGLIDEARREGRRNAQFIILGSASIDLLRQSSETLAGRIAYTELYPLTAAETGANTQDQLWLRGGFPDSFLARTDRTSIAWRREFIRTYLERDIPQLGPRIAAETLRRFWTMLAHLQGGLVNQADIARSLGVDGKTVASYVDLMVDLLLVRRLQPWHANVGKRLVKSPKTYVRDSGLLHALLQIDTHDALLSHPKLGDSWEGFVIENLIAIAPEGTEPFFYRTNAGAEIDLVLQLGAERWAIEIKRTSAPKLSKGFHVACEDIQPTRKFVVHGGAAAFPMGEGVEGLGLMDIIGALAGAKKG